MTEYTPAQKEALTLGKSISVTAGAGTGKTFLLTQRYLALLASGALPKDITALTYTEKAAAEMQTKIARELKKQAETNPRMQECLDQFPQAVISTFHGFCLSILKEFAYEAGLDPGFSVMDDLDKAELVEDTIQNIIDNPDDELFDALVRLHTRMPQSTIRSIIRTLLQADERWFALLRTEPETVRKTWFALCRERFEFDEEFAGLADTIPETEYLKALQSRFFEDPVNRSLINRLETADTEHLKKGRKKYAELAKSLRTAETPEKIRELCAGFSGKEVDGKKEFPIPEEETNKAAEFIRIFAALSYLPGKDSELFTFTREILLDLFDTASACKKSIIRKKQRAGVLDFDDLIVKTDELLSEKHPEILKTVSARCRYLLVDEVQDNDPALIRLLKKLCGTIRDSDRLFIVGDAKQSIYLFRGADPAGYAKFREEFGDSETALDTSFRSVPEIIQFVNELFGNIFPKPGSAEKDSCDPEYNPVRANRTKSRGSVKVISAPYRKGYSGEEEADILASWIYDCVTNKKLTVYDADETPRPAEFSDVAILLQKRKRLPVLCAALERYGVPYTEEGGKDFYRRQEVADLYHLLSAVLCPEDDIPLYGALRSPYCSVPDAELEEAAYGTFGTLHSRLSRFAGEHPKSRIAEALATLSRWREYAGRMTPTACLERILSESEIYAVYAGLPDGDRREGNLQKLCAILRGRCSSRAFSLYEFLSLLERSQESAVKDSEGDPADERDGRVRIITVHSSKGLEYPVVCVCFAGEQKRLDTPLLAEDSTFGYSVSVKLPWMEKKSKSILHAVSEETWRNQETAELKRLFYVALTRARDHLVLCGAQENKEKYANPSFMRMYMDGCKCLSEKPEVISMPCCTVPETAVSQTVSWDTACFVPDTAEEELVFVSKKEAEALSRGTRLHAVFAGEADDAEFAGQYAAFLSCPLMKEVIFERCEMPVMTGGARRVIDRFVQYADGSYAVIDYKTGLLSAAEKSGLFAEYTEQVSAYVSLMREMTGGTVSGWLYFADEEEEKRIIRVL